MRGREYERIVWMATTRMVVDFDVDWDLDWDDETEGGYNGGDRVVVIVDHHHHCQNRFQTSSSGR